ncbi:HNH endonuclease [Pseudomonas syringae]|uniref:HNH endonuclease n=1 Tax=Pseudomonas syringae TaxID=317 RepID=UPI003F76EAB9
MSQARRGQGIYRKQLLELWDGKCAVTGLIIQTALIASHAKRWVDSTDEERLDPCNDLPLMATLDRLFDNYLIAFAPECGKMLISHRIEEADRAILGVPASLLKKSANDRPTISSFTWTGSNCTRPVDWMEPTFRMSGRGCRSTTAVGRFLPFMSAGFESRGDSRSLVALVEDSKRPMADGVG